MEQEGKGVDSVGKRREFMGKKLKRVLLVGKRGGPCTPPPTWRLEYSSPKKNDNSNCSSTNYIQEFLAFPPTADSTTAVSARKLCANLWEVLPHHHHHHLPLAKMSKGGGGAARRGCHHTRQDLLRHGVDPPHSPLNDQPVDATSLRHGAAPVIRHHLSAERNSCPQQPASPTSFSSSLEVATYNPAVTPPSSVDFKGKMGESSHTLKTSTELLKVLNRIWSLEEQHSSNMSLVKGLKAELGRSHGQIKELLKERQREQQAVDTFLKQVAEDKITRKNKEIDRIKTAVHSVRNELEDERKLRKHSENLHRKLVRELSDVKASFSDALRELDRERRARILLESLCDEFAKGIRDYEQEVRSLRNKYEKDQTGVENPDRLILHISEAWIDERLQMKIAESQNCLPEKTTIVDKLGIDIETFLRAKEVAESRKKSNFSRNFPKESCLHQHSLESFPLNEAASAPQVAVDEETTDDDSNNLEINKSSNDMEGKDPKECCYTENVMKSNSLRKSIRSQEIAQDPNISSLHTPPEEILAGASSCNRNRTQFEDRVECNGTGQENRLLSDKSIKSKNCEDQQDIPERKGRYDYGHGDMTGECLPSLQGDKNRPVNANKESYGVQPAFRGNSSPVQQWVSKLTPQGTESPSFPKHCEGVKEDTLKAKLLEARSKSQRSRLKASRSSF